MSLASTDRLQALKELRDNSGETLLFREEERRLSNRGALKGIVDRNPLPSKLDRGQVNLVERADTVIELVQSDLDAIPNVGESIEDSAGMFHRVQEATRTDISYVCRCKLSEDA